MSHTVGVELIMEANETYWRKVPSVRRLVFKVVPEPTTRAAMLRSSRHSTSAVRFGPIFEFLWPSGIGPRVEEPARMLIKPYPWSAPLEEVQLKRK